MKEMREAIQTSKELVFIGYSLPSYDTDLSDLFRKVASDGKRLTVVSPDKEALTRFRTLAQSVNPIAKPFEDSLPCLFPN